VTDSDEGFRTLGDLEAAARRKLTDPLWDLVEGGAGEERTVEANRAAFRRYALRPRAFADVSSVDLAAPILGTSFDAPFFVAPTAYQGSIHPDGEVATARAAAAAHVLSVFSTVSTLPLERIAGDAPAFPRWFQLYLQPDFSATEELVRRAEAVGFTAIVLTTDVPVLGSRDRQYRSGLAIDRAVPFGNGSKVIIAARHPTAHGATYRLPPPADATWEIVDRVRALTRLPLLIKGVLTAADARQAIVHGAKGIVVSNHGGRQLDGARATLDALPEVVDAVGTHAEVYLDGGVRRGSDILIALALGARAVGIGRPILWALATGGEAGVARYFELLKMELAISMAIAGRRSIAEIDRTLVERVSAAPS
jgi:4-hydroxymandelate oxidase